MRSRAPDYIPGDRLVECEVCGFVYRFSTMRRGISDGQRGIVVCQEDFDKPQKTSRRRPGETKVVAVK